MAIVAAPSLSAIMANPSLSGVITKVDIYKASTLPSASVANQTAFVIDSNQHMAAGAGDVVAGGGSNLVAVSSDGANWIIGFPWPSWVVPGATVDFDFVNSRYYGTALLSLLSISRASSGYAKKSDGSWTQFSDETLRQTDQGLLIEETRTNLIAASEGYGIGGPWYAGSATIAPGTATGPDNVANSAGSLIEDNTSNSHIGLQAITKAASSVTYAFACSFAAAGRTRIFLGLMDGSLANGVQIGVDIAGAQWYYVPTAAGSGFSVVSYAIKPEIDGYIRVEIVFSTNSDTTIEPVMYLDNGVGLANASINYQGNGTSGVHFWGCDLQVGGVNTSPIRTDVNRTSPTRHSDDISVNDPYATSLVDQSTSVSLFLELAEPPVVSSAEVYPFFVTKDYSSFLAVILLNNVIGMLPVMKASWNSGGNNTDLYNPAFPYSPAYQEGRIWRMLANYQSDGSMQVAFSGDSNVEKSTISAMPLSGAGKYVSVGSNFPGGNAWINGYLRRLGWRVGVPFSDGQLLHFANG